MATGAQYQLSEKVTLRGGYLYNTNPIPSTATLFNAQAPGTTQHTLSLGASIKLTPDITATTAWVHGFRNAISGGVEQLPGASTRLDTQTDSLVFGLNVQFGRTRKVTPSTAPEESVVPAPAPAAIEAGRSISTPTEAVATASGEAVPR